MSGDDPTLKGLWFYNYVASTPEEADQQADRQMEPFIGRVVEWDGDGDLRFDVYCRRCRAEECPHIPKALHSETFLATRGMTTPTGDPIHIEITGLYGVEPYEAWSGEDAVPYWRVRIVDPEVRFVKKAGDDVPDGALGLVVDSAILERVELEIPAVGTAAGFGDRDPAHMIWPEPTGAEK